MLFPFHFSTLCQLSVFEFALLVDNSFGREEILKTNTHGKASSLFFVTLTKESGENLPIKINRPTAGQA